MTHKIYKNEFGAEYIRIGEDGRGRRYTKVFLHNHDGLVREDGYLELPEVFDCDYWQSKSGLLHLDISKKGKKVAYLDSYGGYSRRRNGVVYTTQPDRVIALGNGADGDAGRIGQWDIALVDVTDCIAVARMSGHYDDDCIFVVNGEVHREEVESLDVWAEENELEIFSATWQVYKTPC